MGRKVVESMGCVEEVGSEVLVEGTAHELANSPTRSDFRPRFRSLDTDEVYLGGTCHINIWSSSICHGVFAAEPILFCIIAGGWRLEREYLNAVKIRGEDRVNV